MPIKEFKTAAKRAQRKAKGDDTPTSVKFKLDDREITAHPPKEAALVMLAASTDDDNPAASAIEITRFLDSCLTKSDRDHIASRLRDPDDTFDFTQLVDIFEFVVEELTGRPTESSSD